jgi:hypothetical protein
MTDEWKLLTPEQKKLYEEMQGREKARYEAEMRDYRKKQGT